MAGMQEVPCGLRELKIHKYSGRVWLNDKRNIGKYRKGRLSKFLCPEIFSFVSVALFW